jgi:branched-chain amino acid transport system substrate-binding protein
MVIAARLASARPRQSPDQWTNERTRVLNGRTLVPALAASAIAVLAAAGCSSSSSATGSTAGSVAGNTVDVYSSLPMQGSSSAQTIPMVNGIKLALSEAHNKAGNFNVKYTELDDSTAAAGKWDPTQTAANAREAATDPKAVYYIGEFNSGASEVSIPILNQAGLAQVSPANTYVGLTTNLPGSAPGEPQKYYPSGSRNYLRIVPIDSIQAASDLMVMKQAGCTKVAVANDKEAYGSGLATLLGLEKGMYGVNIVSNTGIDPTAANFRSYASTIASQGANCFFFAGIVSNGAVQIAKDVNAALPDAKIFGGDGICTSSFTEASQGGVPASTAKLIECTVATQNLTAYPGGKQFLADYKAAYGVASPDPYAIYGFEAMQLGLQTIKSLGANGADKADVLKALFSIKSTSSVLGTFGFNKDGDTTLKSYGVYKVAANGVPVFFETLTPTKTVS